MDQAPLCLHPSVALATALTLLGATGLAHAQSRDCSIAPRAIGVSIGRVSPYLDLSPGAVDNVPRGSILVRNGFQLAGRGDLPIAGPWRARVEAAAAAWPVVRQTYTDDFQLSATETAGQVSVRQIAAMIGRQGGRSPVCDTCLRAVVSTRSTFVARRFVVPEWR